MADTATSPNRVVTANLHATAKTTSDAEADPSADASLTSDDGATTNASSPPADYTHYTPTELKHIVNTRGLPDPYPPGVTLKHFYIRALEKADRVAEADRHMSFRFLDLPPELRLMTYRHLLHFDHDDEERPIGRTFPAVLRTCKLIHVEASDVLYHENTFSGVGEISTREASHQDNLQRHNTKPQMDCDWDECGLGARKDRRGRAQSTVQDEQAQNSG